jgi:hypothetical protein
MGAVRSLFSLGLGAEENGMTDRDNLHVEVRGKLIIVSQAGTQSYAIYTKPFDQPQLVLISSDATEDHDLRARIWQAAIDKARELGWIV